jgi:hypothetical protein
MDRAQVAGIAADRQLRDAVLMQLLDHLAHRRLRSYGDQGGQFY